jgi:hypothetical protein
MPAFRRFAILASIAPILAAPATRAVADCDPARYLGDPVTVTTGPNPLFSVARDFNEDGWLDLAITNSQVTTFGGGSISILIGTPTGFAPAVNYAAGPNPFGMVTGDFDEDGILDLAVGNFYDNRVSILRGQGAGGVGNGTFGASTPYSVGGSPFQIVTGDYDEDGILDLAVAINSAPRIAVLRGNGAGGVGDGTFGAHQNYPLNQRSTGIAQDDFNSDGILDLVATENFGGTVGVLLGGGSGGVGNGTFLPAVHFAAGPEPFDVDVFDYNKDGIQDLAVASAAGGGTRVLRGLGSGGVGTGSFALQATLATGNSGSVAVGDVNEDGLVDLLAAENTNPVGRRFHVFLGQGTPPVGNGTWVSAGPPVAIIDHPYQLLLADLNGDQHEDLVVTASESNRITVLTWACRELVPPPPDLRPPVLTRVRDVPGDEGGRVYLTWLASSLDVPNGAVLDYRVWREIPEEQAPSPAPAGETIAIESRGPDGQVRVTFWESIATLPAQRLAGYGYTAATTEDSTAAHPVSTAFFVSALTANVNEFYSSDVVRGASVDNLAPQAPANFRLETGVPGTLVLAWSPSPEPDLGHYRLERSVSADFPAEGTTGTDVESDTVYVDAGPSGDAYWRIAAVDLHDNVGAWSPTLHPAPVAAGDGPPVLALAGARPNPATSREVTLLFSLSGAGAARLDLFDVRGRRVASPSLAGLGPGPHALRLDAQTALAPGVYVIRLAEGSRAVERKLVVAP